MSCRCSPLGCVRWSGWGVRVRGRALVGDTADVAGMVSLNE